MIGASRTGSLAGWLRAHGVRNGTAKQGRNSGAAAGVQLSVRKFRWFDPDPDERSLPVPWRLAALPLATLFLNIPFWYVHGMDFRWWCPLPVYALGLGAAACVLTVLFFIGPAFATQAAGKPLAGVFECSFGTLPAQGLRFVLAAFLAIWIARLMVAPGLLWLIRDVSPATVWPIVAAVLAFLFVTGVQSPRTNAKLALFTNKLAIAILIAAFVRVHHGWPAITKGFWSWRGYMTISQSYYGLSGLCSYVAPVALLAGTLGFLSGGHKQIVKIGLFGIALPLFGSLLCAGVLEIAVAAYPGGWSSVAVALLGGVAYSAERGPMLLAAVTILGAGRFGARALSDLLSIRVLPSPWRWIPLGCAVPAILWLTFHVSLGEYGTNLNLCARVLAAAAAVLTADAVSGKHWPKPATKIDAGATIALLAGLWRPSDPEWLLPSYVVVFLVRLLIGALQRIRPSSSRCTE